MLRYLLPVGVVIIGIYFYNDTSVVIHKVGEYLPFLKSTFHGTSNSDTVSKTTPPTKGNSEVRLFTPEELKKYVTKENGLYLAILGEVYDVSKGEKYYGPGGSYSFFTGRDGSRAFVTGDFTENGLNDDIRDLEPQDIKSLYQWVSLYKKDYEYKGKLIGRYYDSEGYQTVYSLEVQNKFNQAERDEEARSKQNLMFPPCNTEWSVEQGSRVWCSKMSGGIHRDWVGVPRMLFTPGSDSHRCACVNVEDSNRKGNLKEYPDCHPKATSCYVKS